MHMFAATQSSMPGASLLWNAPLILIRPNSKKGLLCFAEIAGQMAQLVLLRTTILDFCRIGPKSLGQQLMIVGKVALPDGSTGNAVFMSVKEYIRNRRLPKRKSFRSRSLK